MTYLVEGREYVFSYSELKDCYQQIVEMNDSTFMDSLPVVLHTACFICFVKEIPTYLCLSDRGIIHELIHLLNPETRKSVSLKDVRRLFEDQLKLA